MAASWEAILTLILLIVAGPTYYASLSLLRRWRGGHVEEEKEKNEQKEGGRETVTTSQYLFSLIGYAIGIGNVWRFPYVISQNGGAAAVVAYAVCAILVAVPLFLYEMIVGQHTRLSTMRCYEAIRPRWQSLGLAQALMLVIVQSYFIVIISYTLPFIVASCMEPLPWIELGAANYWSKNILNKYEDLNDKPSGMGPIQWRLAISLLIVWMMNYFAIAFGKPILAKVTYVTVITPVLLMLVLVARTVFLEGASEGIAFYIGKFEASQLGRLEVWATACSQILFSLSPGFGTAITFSSYTHPKEDVYKICMIVATLNSLFSITGGFAVFAMVGHLAHKEGLPVEEVATSGGAGLAFITIAESMQYFGGAQNVMSLLFFVMLLTLGLDSSFAWVETLVSYVEDFTEKKGWQRRPTWQTTLAVSICCFSIGLPFCTRMGSQILDVVDHFVGTVFLLIICFLESIMFNMDFKWQRMSHALREATKGNEGTPEGRQLFSNCLCRFDFHISVPVMTLGLGVYIVYFDVTSAYGGYPSSLLAWGWTLLGLLASIIPLTLWKSSKGTLIPLEMEDHDEECLTYNRLDHQLD